MWLTLKIDFYVVFKNRQSPFETLKIIADTVTSIVFDDFSDRKCYNIHIENLML